MPMAISMIPPTALILFPKIFPITLPNKKHANEREKGFILSAIAGNSVVLLRLPSEGLETYINQRLRYTVYWRAIA
jgi:hypothetical protein